MDFKKIGDQIKKFLKSMLSADGDVSSKRVVGFGAFLLFAEEVNAHIWAGKAIQVEVLYTTVGLICACFGLNAYLASKKIQAENKDCDNPDQEDKTKI